MSLQAAVTIWFFAKFSADDGGHDVIDNFEFPCNLMESLISIWNFTNTVMKNVK